MKFLCKKLFTGEIFVLILFCEEIMADEAGESCGFCGCWRICKSERRTISGFARNRPALRRAQGGGLPLAADCGAGGCAEKWGESRAFSDEDRAVLRRATKGGIFGERRTAVGGKGN